MQMCIAFVSYQPSRWSERRHDPGGNPRWATSSDGTHCHRASTASRQLLTKASRSGFSDTTSRTPWLAIRATFTPNPRPYGQRAGTFLSNAGVLQVFGVNDHDSARLVSDLLGQETVVFNTVDIASLLEDAAKPIEDISTGICRSYSDATLCWFGTPDRSPSLSIRKRQSETCAASSR